MDDRLLRYWRALYVAAAFIAWPVWYAISSKFTLEDLLWAEAFSVALVIFCTFRIRAAAHRRERHQRRVREAAREDERGFFLILRSFTQISHHETRGG